MSAVVIEQIYVTTVGSHPSILVGHPEGICLPVVDIALYPPILLLPHIDRKCAPESSAMDVDLAPEFSPWSPISCNCT